MVSEWPFSLSFTKTHAKTISGSDISVDDVLRILHDPPALAGLNALVTKCQVLDPSKPNLYTLHDDLRIFGLFKKDIVYTVNFLPTSDGTDTEVKAGLWTTLKEQWRVVKKGENGEVTVSEKVTVRCLFLFLPFILFTITGAHSRLLEKLEEKVIAEAKAPSSIARVDPSSVMFAYIAILVALASLWYFETRTSFVSAGISTSSTSHNDPYGLFHLSLNRRSGEDENEPPKTEWLNMGYWKVNAVKRIRALALKLIQTAQCKEGGKILDVGHGTGESLIMLLTHTSVPRPGYLSGITSIPMHHQRSLERVKSIVAADTKITLHVGDAVYHQDVSAANHPLNPSSAVTFDNILALDCAYHFQSRETFLRQSFHQLDPGGRISLADICFANTPPMTWKARLVRRFLKLMPKENAITISEYANCLERIGYVDVKVEDISEEVFPGFVGFLKPRGLVWWIFGSVLYSYHGAGARFVIASGYRSKESK
ncbi:S-adenosyl-L-methionine-dependent methyltransferase [Lentinula edodes]|nr:S-adenosyl-L-methionine-dependent methyltransferase [Lentinula edodes]